MLKITPVQVPDSRLISSLVPMPLLKAALFTAAMSWLILQGQRSGIYDTGLAVSFVAIASTVAFAVSNWRIDVETQRSSQALATSSERYRAFVEQSSEGIWRFELEEPMPTSYSEDEQIEHFYQYGYLAECNNVMAQMYGFSSAEEIVGVRLGNFLLRSEPHNIEYLLKFIRSGYRLVDAESYEVDKFGASKYFLNNLVGIVENDALVRAWGTQRDISDRKRTESLLRCLVESNLIGIMSANFQGQITEANDAWLNIVGYTREEVLGGKVNFLEITPPEYRHLDWQAMEEMKRTGSHTPFEKEYIRKDGTRVPVLVGTAYLGASQDAGVGFLLDLTELKRAEASLQQLTNQVQEQANTLDAILSASVDNIYILDCAGRYKYVSAGGAQALGLKPIDVIGKTWRDLGLPPDIMQPLDEQREKVISTKQPLQKEVDFSTPSGVRHYEYIISPFYKDESIEGIVVISRDTTDRQQTEKALQESEERFRTLVEQSPFSTQILAPDGQTLQVNRSWEELWGVTLDQIPEYNILLDQQLVDKGVMPYIKKGFAGECVEIPAIVYDPEETIPNRTIHKEPQRWVRAFIYPVKNRDGSIREVVLVHEDISERKRAAEALALSEAKFRRLVDSNIIGVIIAEYTGNIIEANDAFLQMLGYTREEIIAGKIDWRAITPPEYLPQDRRVIEELKQTGACAPFEKEYIRSDGSRVPVLLGCAVLESSKDTTICFVLDLSDRKQAESKLSESEERFRLLAEKVRIIPWEADAKSGKFTYVGPQTVELLGYLLEEWYTDNFWGDRMHPQDREWAIKYCVESSATLDNYEFEYRMLSADGKSVWLYDIVNVVRDENEPQLLRGFMIDITRRKQAEEALQETNQALEALIVREQAARESAEAANRMKDEFLATLSHELRTPLNPIQGWVQLLRSRKFDEAATARALETIDRNTKLLAQLIEDVLDVSRIITGKMRLNLSPIQIVPVIEAAIDTVQPAADAKSIELKFSILDSPLADTSKNTNPGASQAQPDNLKSCIQNPKLLVAGDSNRLQQVIWNLLSNAVKFTPKGGRVSVQLSSDSRSVQVRVSDTGKGISPEFLPYVFERFRQADASITRAYGGLGLGLAIVRHLVELHGGTVEAKSPGEGQGATFIVQLPLLSEREQVGGQRSLAPSPPRELLLPDPRTDSSPLLLDGLRVLVVDDEPDARDLLIAILAEDGAEVTAVPSAAEALLALQRLQPNILVSDIGMPGEDGYTLIRKVRALDAKLGGQIPAVALTAYASTSDRIQALSAGFQLHVPKPIDAAELAAAIANLAGRTHIKGYS